MIIYIIVALLLATLLYTKTSKPARLPPGSFGWPVYGSIPPRNVHITKHLSDLRSKYGNIFTTKWGSRIIIVLADMHWIKKGLSHPGLHGRGFLQSLKILGYDTNHGVLTSSGKVWSDTRRFLLRHLRDLGMGKTHLSYTIQEEVQAFISSLEDSALDKPVEMGWSINVAVLNVLWQMLAGIRCNENDKEVIEYSKIVSEDMKIVQGPLALFAFMPWLPKLLPEFLTKSITRKDVLDQHRDYFFHVCRKLIADHEVTLDPDNPKDVIDYYLLEVEANKNDPETTFKPDHVNLINSIADLFAAGTETTSASLRFMIIHLALRPDIQSKAQSTIDAVVPRDRLPSLEDRPKLPYLDATMLDVLRLASINPVSIPHAATETVRLDNYIIPKDALVLPCLELSHRDPNVWKFPNELYPEHFLDDQGKLDSKKESYIPFGLGRRQCMGESLARMQLYLFLAAILQRFTIEPPPGVQLVLETCPNEQFLNTPKPFQIVLKKRI